MNIMTIDVAAGALEVFDFGALILFAMKRIYLPGAAGFEAVRKESMQIRAMIPDLTGLANLSIGYNP